MFRSHYWNRFRRYIIPPAILTVGAFGIYNFSSENHPSHYDHQNNSQLEPILNSTIPSRRQQLNRLRSNELFDVLVIGGGNA